MAHDRFTKRTKGHVPIPHPCRHLERLKCSKSSMFATSKQIPDDGGLTDVVADDKSSGTSFAHVVDGDELNVVAVVCESSLHRQGIMVEAEYDGALGEEKQRRGGGTWRKVGVDRPPFALGQRYLEVGRLCVRRQGTMSCWRGSGHRQGSYSPRRASVHLSEWHVGSGGEGVKNTVPASELETKMGVWKQEVERGMVRTLSIACPTVSVIRRQEQGRTQAIRMVGA